MEIKSATNELISLIHLNINAMHAYKQAIKHIDFTPIRGQLEIFLEEHERHAVKLSKAVRSFGVEPPELSRDFKGFMMEGFASLLSVTGTRMALEAMKTNEKLTNRKYKEALDQSLPSDARSLVEENYSDEQKHLAYIEKALAEHLWEK